ncbi:MAG: 4-vinyl reductase [Candidatus Woesearchaeota archaeon]
MIDSFIKKLLFIRQFWFNDGRFEILGIKRIGIPINSVIRLQSVNPEKFSEIIKEEAKKEFEFFEKKLNQNKTSLINVLPDLLNTYGLGKFIIVDLNLEKKTAIINVQDSLIATEFISHKIKTTKPVCNITGAILKGVFEYLFEKEVNYSETKCITQGAKLCEFIINY